MKLPDKVSPPVASFLAACDAVLEDRRIPTLATALIEGKLTLILGQQYLDEPEACQAADLEHEVGHFIGQHLQRCGERDPLQFNIVCDAAINEQGIGDYKLVDAFWATQGIENRSPRFDRLPHKDGGMIPPCPPEVAYTMLPKSSVGPGGGCGSIEHSTMDNSAASLVKAIIVNAAVLAANPFFKQGSEGGDGMATRAVPELPPVPPWIRAVLEYLLKTVRSHARQRSWRREHRGLPGTLPGQGRSYAPACRVLLDASGSIGPELLGQFLSALVNTPELAESDVVVFDSAWGDPLPVSNAVAILNEARRRGGGTAINAVGCAMRPDGRPVVWLTDAVSGDGFPPPHTTNEIWCVHGKATPPHGIVIRIGG